MTTGSKRVLVVVDMQKDFIDGSLGSRDAQAIVQKVICKIKAFDGTVIYTQDTHKPDYLTTQEGKNLPVEHCIFGTPGWEIPEDIYRASDGKRDPGMETVLKGTFGSVELAAHLRAARVEQVELVGLCTDICVISNAMVCKAFMPEARIAVDSSCCAGVTPESHETALAAMKACQVEVI